jgi:hypothetical protein
MTIPNDGDALRLQAWREKVRTVKGQASASRQSQQDHQHETAKDQQAVEARFPVQTVL